MNHQKIYQYLIENAAQQFRNKLKKDDRKYVYYENHHILPRCLGGSEEKDNLVLLTAKEHFVCHKLLTYIYPNNRSVALGFSRMTFSKRLGNIVSSRDYKYAKELLSSISMSKETKEKISKTQKGRKRSAEFKRKVSIGMMGVNKNKSLTEDHKKKLSEAKMGVKNPNKQGLSNEHKEKIRKSNLGLKRSIEAKQKMSEVKKGSVPWNKGNKNTYRGKLKKT